MASPKEYQNRLAAAVGGKLTKKGLELEFEPVETLAEMQNLRKRIVQMQKDVRFIKKQINQDMKGIRQVYKQRAANVQPGFLASVSGKGTARKDMADKKRKLAGERDATLHPYNALKLGIDNLLTQLDSSKLELDVAIEQKKAEQQPATARSAKPRASEAFCPECGQQVATTDKFCRGCGKKL